MRTTRRAPILMYLSSPQRIASYSVDRDTPAALAALGTETASTSLKSMIGIAGSAKTVL